MPKPAPTPDRSWATATSRARRWLAVPLAAVAVITIGFGANEASRSSFAALGPSPVELGGTPTGVDGNSEGLVPDGLSPDFRPGASDGAVPLPPIEFIEPPPLPSTTIPEIPDAQPSDNTIEIPTSTSLPDGETVDDLASQDPSLVDPDANDTDNSFLAGLGDAGTTIRGSLSASLIVFAVALAMVLVVGRYLIRYAKGRLARRRAQSAHPTGPLSTAEMGQLLLTVQNDPDPNRAIRLAFAATDRGFAQIPRRNLTDTPSEWARTVATRVPAGANPSAALSALYSRVRFSPTPACPEDRTSAAGYLRQLTQINPAALDQGQINPTYINPTQVDPTNINPTQISQVDHETSPR